MEECGDAAAQCAIVSVCSGERAVLVNGYIILSLSIQAIEVLAQQIEVINALINKIARIAGMMRKDDFLSRECIVAQTYSIALS